MFFIVMGIVSLVAIITMLILAACKCMADIHRGLQVYKEEECEENYDGMSGYPLQHPSNYTDHR